MNLPHNLANVALFCLLLTLTACAGADKREQYIVPGTTTMKVESLDIRGVDRFSTADITSGLATKTDPGWRAEFPWSWLPLIGKERYFFNLFDWRRDVERILIYYRQRGYFNVEVQRESIIENPTKKTVRITLVVEEGLPTEVSTIKLSGLRTNAEFTEKEILEKLPLQKGDVFTQQKYLATIEAIRTGLLQRGHAYAHVAGRVYVMPENYSAEVEIFIDAGPKSFFGEAHVFGLESVEERYVRQALPIKPGDKYSPKALIEAQQDIYDLGVFGLVTVLPAHESNEELNAKEDQERGGNPKADTAENIQAGSFSATSSQTETDSESASKTAQTEDQSENSFDVADYDSAPPEESIGLAQDPAEIESQEELRSLGISGVLATAQRQAEKRSQLSEEIPLVIRLKEAKKYRVRLGAGIAIEDTRQDIRALVNWSSRNFLGGLRKLEHITAAGYAWAPGILAPEGTGNKGVILSTELRFSQPQFFERLTQFRMRARIDRDIQEGYKVWNPSLRLSVDRSFFRHLLVDVAYSVSYFNYSDVNEGLLDLGSTGLGQDFRPEFLLEFFEQSVSLDYRNDILNPGRGFLTRFTIQEAGNYVIGGDFDYIRATLMAEGYIPYNLFTPTVIALRARIGSVYSIGSDPTGVPVQSRLNSGGSDGMRAFGRKRLSLYTHTGEPVPVGGLTLFEASIEPRFLLAPKLFNIGDLWGALFVDAATVLQGQFLFDTPTNDQGVEEWGNITDSMLYGAGAGIWWITPVGPVRLDGALLLSSIADDARFRRCVDPRTTGTNNCTFVPQKRDPIQKLIPGYSFYLSIGHSF